MDGDRVHVDNGGAGVSKRRKEGNERKSAAKAKAAEGRLARMLLLPLEIFLEIARYVSPKALLQMSRASKGLREVLMSKSSKPIWRAAWLFSGIPQPPSFACEPLYAALIFDRFCHGCGASETKGANVTLKVDIACHIRLCSDCFDNDTLSIEQAKYFGEEEAEVQKIVNVMPYFKQLSPHREPRALTFYIKNKFSLIEFYTLLEEYRDVKENLEAAEQFLAERLCAANDRIEFKRQYWSWFNLCERERKAEIQVKKEERQDAIHTRLFELGYSHQDIRYTPWRLRDGNSRKWRNLVLQTRPLSEKIWITLRPQLEEILRDWREEREKKIETNKKLRMTELAELYGKFCEETPGPNFLPCSILAQVPRIAAELSKHDYYHPLAFGDSTSRAGEQIRQELPNILKRFHRMVMDDYLNAAAGFDAGSQEGWAERFSTEEDTVSEEPNSNEIADARKALSFVDTAQGICSYEMLEAVGWWTPILPALPSVRQLAKLVLAQLRLSDDTPMSHMTSYTFSCVRCESTEIMTWISLLDHFKSQLMAHENQSIRNSMLDLGLRPYGSHSHLDPSPVVNVLGPYKEVTGNAQDARPAALDVTSNLPTFCTMCKSLDVETSFSTKDDVQSHFLSQHHGCVIFDA
ncbi:hypothetical protein SCHPADRAFT_884252 [Schizopora paradoxa]|uniref:F-box domain-containing protein n=1 Tax=Schizopora paradoxa TaxID=27342 RepID=A0A0H2QZ64_9AGAM|nr:hypothetical protein SCHPADRAFT_884252 [Schizopora paradoxa]